ncbi:MAG: DUF3221 domain-containing protein [Clostridia bacterium]|nr:DUF3221 domain-containing protein [Clostridia bacterium]
MRKWKLLIIFLALSLILAGCGKKEESAENSFTATVLEINDASLLVEPAEGSGELKSADRIIVSVKDAKIIDAQGNEITIDDLETGKQVEIYYTGGIAESYPAKIYGCWKVKVLD